MAIAYVALIIIPLFVGIIFLQIYLSKMENKWVGLILPFISFAISVIAVLGLAMFSFTTSSVQTINESGKVINQVIEQSPVTQIADTSTLVYTAIITFVLYNIPTGILLGIYAGCRNRIKKNKELEKMSVQDLE